MLVGAFHIDVSDAVLGPVLTIPQDEGVGRAGIEPDIKDVEDLLIVIDIKDAAEEALLRAVHIPTIGAFGFEGLSNAGVHLPVPTGELGVGGQCGFIR